MKLSKYWSLTGDGDYPTPTNVYKEERSGGDFDQILVSIKHLLEKRNNMLSSGSWG